jgi:hypothetical protein
LSIQAEDGLGLLELIRRGQINAISHHRRRPVTAPGEGRLPEDVLVFSPLGRGSLTGRGDAVSGRSAPSWPVLRRIDGGIDRASGEQEGAGCAEPSRKRCSGVHGICGERFPDAAHSGKGGRRGPTRRGASFHRGRDRKMKKARPHPNPLPRGEGARPWLDLS